jgi:hypothetical protein
VLRVFLKDSESIGNTAGLAVFLCLQELIELFKLATSSEFHVARSFSHKFIARSDVSFHNFLQILEKLLIANLELGADSRTRSLLKLLDINVDDVVGKEFPS